MADTEAAKPHTATADTSSLPPLVPTVVYIADPGFKVPTIKPMTNHINHIASSDPKNIEINTTLYLLIFVIIVLCAVVIKTSNRMISGQNDIVRHINSYNFTDDGESVGND